MIQQLVIVKTKDGFYKITQMGEGKTLKNDYYASRSRVIDNVFELLEYLEPADAV